MANENPETASPIVPSGRLVDAVELLRILFTDESRPSLRWLREQQKAKSIPFVRVGRLIFFDPPKVRAKLASRNTVGI